MRVEAPSKCMCDYNLGPYLRGTCPCHPGLGSVLGIATTSDQSATGVGER